MKSPTSGFPPETGLSADERERLAQKPIQPVRSPAPRSLAELQALPPSAGLSHAEQMIFRQEAQRVSLVSSGLLRSSNQRADNAAFSLPIPYLGGLGGGVPVPPIQGRL